MGNQTLGRGELHFALFQPGTTTPGGFRYLGNSPDFSTTIANTYLDHYGSDRGIKEKDKSILLQTDATGALTLDDISIENLAIYFLGSNTVVSQTTATDSTQTFSDVVPGLNYQIGMTDDNPTGVRSITTVVVKVATTTKVLGTDYDVDLDLGIWTPLVGGSIDGSADVDITYDRTAVSRDQVISGDTQVEGALRYLAYNPEGENRDFFMPQVRLSANGDFALKGDSWLKLTLKVDILKLPNRERIYVDGRAYTPPAP